MKAHQVQVLCLMSRFIVQSVTLSKRKRQKLKMMKLLIKPLVIILSFKTIQTKTKRKKSLLTCLYQPLAISGNAIEIC
jgi:hypothetical protein